jgi:hypothetical protein
MIPTTNKIDKGRSTVGESATGPRKARAVATDALADSLAAGTESDPRTGRAPVFIRR